MLFEYCRLSNKAFNIFAFVCSFSEVFIRAIQLTIVSIFGLSDSSSGKIVSKVFHKEKSLVLFK